MKTRDQKLLSRALDSECSEAQRRTADALLATDPDAKVLQETWSELGDRMRSLPAPVVDEELAWMNVQREIRSGRAEREALAGVFGPRLAWAFGLGLVLFALSILFVLRQEWTGDPRFARSATPINQVEWVETGIPGATTMIFADASTGLTVVWMDVENGVRINDKLKPAEET
ncbi:MAG TPA: hypothetical protein PKE55_03990 [Kiritimatiellia bacterium]|nr:hypothetical protein [Kiritimatiellia bacterium]